MADFTYMGTKKRLAGTISALCRHHAPGPFLDLFSGISAAGFSVAPSRQIWCNDAQIFSYSLTEALFRSTVDRPRVDHVGAIVRHFGDNNLNALAKAVEYPLDEELRLLWDGEADEQIAVQARQREDCVIRRADFEGRFSHCLFTTRYAGSYFGLAQTIQLDAIRYGADQALELGFISDEEHRWALLALCRSIAAISNSTGHFAQYLTPSSTNLHRVLGKRRRCAWAHWLGALEDMRAVGDAAWRAGNRVFHGDAVDVLKKICTQDTRPAVIYADPPYTNDQYSRYYHLLETAVLYDYPATHGKGLYRENRFRSNFSVARNVDDSFANMISEAGQTGASLIVSYPSNGLLTDSLRRIPDLMAQHFSHVLDPLVIPYKHSTLGASKGREKEDVEECIFVSSQTPIAA